jgi:hypothetical protein
MLNQPGTEPTDGITVAIGGLRRIVRQVQRDLAALRDHVAALPMKLVLSDNVTGLHEEILTVTVLLSGW